MWEEGLETDSSSGLKDAGSIGLREPYNFILTGVDWKWMDLTPVVL